MEVYSQVKTNFSKNKISSENFEFKKLSQRATIFALLFMHFIGAPENWCQLVPTDARGPRKVK